MLFLAYFSDKLALRVVIDQHTTILLSDLCIEYNSELAPGLWVLIFELGDIFSKRLLRFVMGLLAATLIDHLRPMATILDLLSVLIFLRRNLRLA